MDQNRDILGLAETIIMQSQYATLSKRTPDRLRQETLEINPSDVTCIFQITELVYNCSEDTLSKFTTILNSLHSCGASCLLLIKCQRGRCEMYIGAVNKQRYNNIFYLNTIRDVLRNGLEGNLPGTELREIYLRKEIGATLRQCIDNGFDSQCITAISCVSGDREESGVLPAGIERLFEAIGNKNFSILLLADPVSSEKITEIRQGYEQIGSHLSNIEQYSVAVQSGKSTTVSNSYSVSMSQSIGKNISATQSHTEGSGWSKAQDDPADDRRRALPAAAGLLTKNYIAMNAMSILMNKPASNISNHTDDSNSLQIGGSYNEQTGKQESTGRSFADSEGITLTYSCKDYRIISLIQRIDWYLQWLNRRENYGMFNCCAYVISSNAGTNMMVASEYQALMQGKRDMNQPATFNTWTRENNVDIVREYLSHLSHPAFTLNEGKEKTTFTPAMLLSSKELSRHMAFPQKSVLGVSVSEYASFGRDIVRKSALKSGQFIRLGGIQHMGKDIPSQPVLLELQSLAAHTFIAGTNGSGKSNTVFKIIEEIMTQKIPFLVIEPAKGEYKNVFGREPNVFVYGTNEKKTTLLQINPFWFNDDVNILEHIDKLVEIFNASWSMYAAMPAVLKAAIEGAYQSCGWDLESSVYIGSAKVFPTFEDVLAEFDKEMEKTSFSQEVKGNYVGALSTRMQTMCNGLYGKIFGGKNLSDEELFERNVIIDLSRVGSVETKSMIMGILIIRIQEYRMQNEAMNLPLQHITILEEAHHLIKRSSFAQSDEGSNMVGKSVEMISCAIAEMRSFGEGFLIVDQSPGLLDMSVMRNTNTKIILRLPEAGDRELVGNTIGLKPEQINEISRFSTGVAVIYQKDWHEAVLCKVDMASHKESLYILGKDKEDQRSCSEFIRPILLKCSQASLLSAVDRQVAQESIAAGRLSGHEKKRVQALLAGDVRGELADYADIIVKLFPQHIAPPNSPDVKEVLAWYKRCMNNDDLKKICEEDCLSSVLLSVLYAAAEKEPLYSAAIHKVIQLTDTQENAALKKARGTALRRIAPYYYRCAPEDPQVLSDAVTTLRSGNKADRMLAELVSNHISNGTCRKYREIVPYSALLWRLFDGESLWQLSSFLIKNGSVEIWDESARKWVRYYMTGDADTETSVLSLLLQHKGKSPDVRSFYRSWEIFTNEKKHGTSTETLN